MNVNSIPLIMRCGLLAMLSIMLFSAPAYAGNIFFGLSHTGNILTLTNQGNSTAFYSSVLTLMPDGSWEPLAAPPGITASAELPPGAHLNLVWPSDPARQQPFPLDAFRIAMVRFFDQAGNGFGQISFFNQPPMAPDLSQGGYVDGLMTISPPGPADGKPIRASWLLWPQEEGIAPLFAPGTFQHKQPPAKRIEWRSGMNQLRLDLGAGMPSAMLLHETPDGYVMQQFMNGGQQGMQQRSAWLKQYDTFINLAIYTAIAAALLMLWHLAGTRRERPAS